MSSPADMPFIKTYDGWPVVNHFPEGKKDKGTITLQQNLETKEYILFVNGKQIKRIPAEDVEIIVPPPVELAPEIKEVLKEDFGDKSNPKEEENKLEAASRQEEVNADFDKKKKKTWAETCLIM